MASSRPQRESCSTPARIIASVDSVSDPRVACSTTSTSSPARAKRSAVAAPAHRAPTITAVYDERNASTALAMAGLESVYLIPRMTWSALPDAKHDAVKRALSEVFGAPQFDDITLLRGGLSTALVFRIVVQRTPYLLRLIMPGAPAGGTAARQFGCM